MKPLTNLCPQQCAGWPWLAAVLHVGPILLLTEATWYSTAKLESLPAVDRVPFISAWR
jgi:hypothetical protein